MKYFGLTDIGRYRAENQDAFGIEVIRDGIYLALVCDGMGGAAGGRIASRLASDTFIAFVKDRMEEILSRPFVMNFKNEAILELVMKQGASAANTAVYNRAKEDPSLMGMGTTLVAALVVEREVFICNVGDSRLYLLNAKEIRQITKDHSYVQMMIDNGMLDPEKAADHPDKNVITRAIGTRALVAGETFRATLTDGDSILLCSDGLTGFVSVDDIHSIMNDNRNDVTLAVKRLVDAANDGGGRDNITALILATE